MPPGAARARLRPRERPTRQGVGPVRGSDPSGGRTRQGVAVVVGELVSLVDVPLAVVGALVGDSVE